MATLYVSGSGSDTNNGALATPYKSLYKALQLTGRANWGDTIVILDSGALFIDPTVNTTTYTIFPNPGAGNGGDLTIIGASESVTMTIPNDLGTTRDQPFQYIGIPAAPNASAKFVWAVNIANPNNVVITQFFSCSMSGAGPTYKLAVGGQSARADAISNMHNTPVSIDLGGAFQAGSFNFISVGGSPTGTVACDIDIYQAKIKGLRNAVFSNGISSAVATPRFTIRSSTVLNYGALYYSNTANSSMHLTILNTSRYNCFGVNAIGSDNSEIVPGGSAATITLFREHNSIWSRCKRDADKMFGQFSTWSATLMADVVANQHNKWFRSNNVCHMAIPYTGQGDFQEFVYTSSRAHYIPFDPTFWLLDPEYIDAANGNFQINPAGNLWVCGRGLATQLPPQDINGQSWTGSDIGAYRNPTSAKRYATINKGLKAIGGDSIALGAHQQAVANYPGENFLPLSAKPAWDAVGNTYAAYGGIKSGGYVLALDYLMTSGYAPQFLGLVLGANNGNPVYGMSPTAYHLAEASPYHNAARRFAADVAVIFKKYMDWAGKTPVYPVWLGMGPLKADDGATSWDYTKQQGWSDAMTRALAAFGSGITTAHYVDEMQRRNPTDWYTGDYNLNTSLGTIGPYYRSLWIHGQTAATGDLDVHPHTAGSLLIADVFRDAVGAIPLKASGGSSSSGFGWQ